MSDGSQAMLGGPIEIFPCISLACCGVGDAYPFPVASEPGLILLECQYMVQVRQWGKGVRLFLKSSRARELPWVSFRAGWRCSDATEEVKTWG